MNDSRQLVRQRWISRSALTLCLVAPATVTAQPQAEATTTVEIVEVARAGVQSTARFSLGLDPQGRTSSIQTGEGETYYTLRLQREHAKARTNLVRLDLTRDVHRPKLPPRRTRIDVIVHARTGQRVQAGRIHLPGTGELQIYLTLN